MPLPIRVFARNRWKRLALADSLFVSVGPDRTYNLTRPMACARSSPGDAWSLGRPNHSPAGRGFPWESTVGVKRVTMKRIVLAVVAVFVAWSALDFVIHGLILASSYEATARLWRP